MYLLCPALPLQGHSAWSQSHFTTFCTVCGKRIPNVSDNQEELVTYVDVHLGQPNAHISSWTIYSLCNYCCHSSQMSKLRCLQSPQLFSWTRRRKTGKLWWMPLRIMNSRERSVWARNRLTVVGKLIWIFQTSTSALPIVQPTELDVILGQGSLGLWVTKAAPVLFHLSRRKDVVDINATE